jgi:hypothetical protein
VDYGAEGTTRFVTTGGNHVDLDRLSMGDKVIAGSTIGFVIFYFLPWFSIDIGAETLGIVASADFNGGDVGFLWGTFPLLLALISVGIIAVRLFAPDATLPELPISYGQLHMALGGLAAFLVVLKLLIGEDGAFGVSIDRSYGLFLATLAALGLAAGGFLKMQEDEGAGSDPTSF